MYSAADVYVCPSLADNLPNTLIESIACGTPAVAFATGGVPEVVRDGVTGLLAKTGDVVALREATLELLENGAKRAEMSVKCRKVAEEEYELEVQARRYLELYESLSSRGAAPAVDGASAATRTAR